MKLLLLILALMTTILAAPGCSLVTDGQTGKVLFKEGNCGERMSPASTFKIPLSLMGYDSGYLKSTTAPALPFYPGYSDWGEGWKQKTDPTAWIKNSVVWYSQRLTEWLGKEQFQRYVRQFDYGNQDLAGDSGQDDGLTNAWLSSSLKISPVEQSVFLTKLLKQELAVSQHAYDMTAQITAITKFSNGWEVNGKPGTGYLDKPVRNRQFGWFVGWARKKGKTVVFVHTILDDHKIDSSAGKRARADWLARLPTILDKL